MLNDEPHSQTNHLRQRLVMAFQLVRLIWQAHPLPVLLIAIVTFLQAAVPLLAAWVTKLIFDLLALTLRNGGSLPWSQLLPLLMLQVAVAIGQQLFIPVRSYLHGELCRKLTLTIQTSLYNKINSFAGLAYFENPAFYDRIRLAEQGAHYAASQTLGNLVAIFQNSIILISFLGMLLAFQPLLAGLLLVAAMPHLFTELKQGGYRFSLMASISPIQRYKFFYGVILSGRHAAKTVRLFGLGTYFLDKLRALLQETHSAEQAQQKRELRWQAGSGGISSLVSSVALVLVIVTAFTGRISLGDITLYIGAIASVQTGLSGLLRGLAGMNESALFFTYYDDLMALPPDISALPPVLPVKPLTAEIELRSVSFRYSEQHPWVLKDVNLKIANGECLALVGLNGAGKTTLVKLLTRLYDPIEGMILWDGVDIRQLDMEALRRRIGVIFQDFLRYDLTVQENIGLGCVEHINDLSLIRQAASQAGIHEAIEAMPNGYQTPLGFMVTDHGKGMDLSGGQWQKLAIARLFMRLEADLLILDEPTAALDAKAEFESYARFADLMNGRATLLISHRFSTVHMADRIAVLENGQITEYGSHDELLSLAGTYAKLYSMQAEKYAI